MITKDKKKEIIKDLIDKLSRQKSVVFFDYTGLKVNQSQELRSKLRQEGIDCQVGRKTLINLALEGAGLKDIGVKEMTGQIGLVLGYKDEVAPAKILYDFSKGNESIKILAGLVEGKLLGNEAILELAKLPSKQELLSKLVGSISSPLYGLRNALRGNLQKLIYILKSCKV
ncbi:MAG: 50S ribosomal protein L10 [Candidatus Portnoybacteria bacterium]